MNKPTNFNDLLELQRVLDENIEKIEVMDLYQEKEVC